MPAPGMYEDSIRKHDVALYTWLGGLVLDYGKGSVFRTRNMPILRVFASPSRAWAKLVNLLVNQQFVSGADAAAMRANTGDFAVLPLPVATIEAGEPAPDPELAGVPKVLRNKYLNPVTGQWEFHRYPAHYRCDYTVTIWTLKRYTSNYVKEWVMGKLGDKGLAQDEFLLPVIHDAPWGTIYQKCQFTGSSDLSNLEGADARYFRTSFSFSLRMWLMRPMLETHYPVERIGLTLVDLHPAFGELSDSGLVFFDDPLDKETENLFYFPFTDSQIAANWTKAGSATVARGKIAPDNWDSKHNTLLLHDTIKIEVTAQSDTVELLERLASPADDDGRTIISTSFNYRANGNVELELRQKNPGTGVTTSADSLILPTSMHWQQVHRFALVDEALFSLHVAGVPNQAQQTAYLNRVDVRAVSPQTRLTPSGPTPVGQDQKYAWTGLTAGKAYLMVVAITGTSGGINTVIAEDDDTTPVYTDSQVVDSAIHRGAVFLIQPAGTTLSMLVPTTATVANIYVQRYYGSYKGHTI